MTWCGLRGGVSIAMAMYNHRDNRFERPIQDKCAGGDHRHRDLDDSLPGAHHRTRRQGRPEKDGPPSRGDCRLRLLNGPFVETPVDKVEDPDPSAFFEYHRPHEQHISTRGFLQLARMITGTTSSDEGDVRIDAETIGHAQKLAGLRFTDEERQVMAEGISSQLSMFSARLNGIELPDSLFPATVFRALLPSRQIDRATSKGDPSRLTTVTPIFPRSAADRYASIAELGHWLRQADHQRRTREAVSEAIEADGYLASLRGHVDGGGGARPGGQADRSSMPVVAGPLHGIHGGPRIYLIPEVFEQPGGHHAQGPCGHQRCGGG